MKLRNKSNDESNLVVIVLVEKKWAIFIIGFVSFCVKENKPKIILFLNGFCVCIFALDIKNWIN